MSAEQPARAVGEPIIGGQTDTSTHGVVALAFVYPQHQVAVFCSGSLLAPNLVLTARHCIAQIGSDPTDEQVDCSTSQFTKATAANTVFVSTDATPQTSNGTLYSVKEIRQAPGSNNVCGYDVALLILNSNVPSSAATPLVPALGVTTKTNEQFAAIGFGLQDPNDKAGKTAGTRMRFDMASVYCVGSACPTAAANAQDEWVGNSPVCSGDSGGPALAAGQVFGVTSRGDPMCSYALYSNVASWADFIQTGARDAATDGGYTAPAWATSSTTPVTGAGAGGSANGSGGSTSGSANVGGTSSAGSGTLGMSGSGTTTEPAGGAGSGGGSDAMPAPIQSMPTVSPLGEACQAANDCPGTYQCYSATAQPPGVCVPPCGSSSASCPVGYSCLESLKVCAPVKPTVDKAQASTSCALSSRKQSGNGAFAALLVLGFAWLGRRRRSAA